MKNLILKTIALSVLTSTFLLGAAPTIGDIEKEIKTPDIKKEQVDIPTIKTKEYKAPMIDSGKTVLIKDFKITGNEHISSLELEKFFSEFKGKELTFNQLQDIASAITKYYREKGYFVARAYIPAQNILENDNVLEIAIIEGNYGEFKLKNNSLVKDDIVQGMLDDAKRDNIVSTSTLERAMLVINDTPGVVVTSADVMPGKLTGTSDFAITTQASKKIDGYTIVDNTGSRYTGKHRLMAGVNFNSPFKIGDKISLSGLISEGSYLKNGRVAYSFPLNYSGLRGEVSYSKTTYSLTDIYKDTDALGESTTLEGKLSYPIIRTRVENLYASLSVARKNLRDEVRSTSTLTKKDSKSVTLAFDYDKSYLAYNKLSNSTARFSLTRGVLNDVDNTNTGSFTDGNYTKVNLDLSNNIAFNQTLSLESSIKMQYALANKNLDGSEDFSVGGSNGVKLYPSGELSAENGYVLTVEGKYKLPEYNSLNSSIGVFYDRGKAWMSKNITNEEAKSLQDVGLGLYANYKQYFGQVQVAWNANSQRVTSEPNRNSRVLFQAGMSF